MAFTLHSDPAHGYLYVTARDLKRVDLSPEGFTTYSFIGNCGGMYLEEDCDLGKFAKRWEKHIGKFEVEMYRFDGPAPCRNLARNTAGRWEPFGPIKGEVHA